MRTVTTTAQLRDALATARSAGASVALVATMGALHDGHLRLFTEAKRRCNFVVATIFVNPTQFRPGEDLEHYPRDLTADRALAAGAGVDLLYAPSVEDIYPVGFATTVAVSGLTEVLCGATSARGAAHFDGVTTVVAKLLNRIDPEVALFGQKDAQQALVIAQMARDLDFRAEIAVIETVRESDGLALSSRNAYLAAPDRARAAALHQALRAVAEAIADGEDDPKRALAAADPILDAAAIEPEYLELRDAERLDSISSPADWPCDRGRVLIAIAAQLGNARLIDNLLITPRLNATKGAPPRCSATC